MRELEHGDRWRKEERTGKNLSADLYNTNRTTPELVLNKILEDLKELDQYLKFNEKRLERKLKVNSDEVFGSLETRYR